MKHVLLVLFAIIFHISLFAQSERVDTIYYESWDNNAWVYGSRTIHTYNASCQLESTVIQLARTGAWNNFQKTTYTHTGAQLSEKLEEEWNGTAWNNYFFTTYAYYGNGKLFRETRQYWGSGTWNNTRRYTYTYNANGDLTSLLEQAAVASPAWFNVNLDTYSYNMDGTVNQWLVQYYQNNWVNYVRISYTYNADKTVQQALEEHWAGAWDVTHKTSFSYDAQGRELTKLIERWVSGAWQNQSRTTTAYQGNIGPASIANQEWDPDQNVWRDFVFTQYTYNSNGSLFQTIKQYALESNNYVLTNGARYSNIYSSACTLPLTLLDFTAILSGKDIVLNWSTSKEINTAYFDVQRSSNGHDFDKMGTVAASYNSTQEIQYRFVDANPALQANGNLYYRLKMVDRDGRYTYSKIAVVAVPATAPLFTIAANTTNDYLVVMPHAPTSGAAAWQIIDQAGRQVFMEKAKPLQAGRSFQIPIAHLPAGIYYLTLVSHEGTSAVKFIK